MRTHYRIAKGTILFDLDGTLLNTFDGITRSVIFALQQMGVKSPPAAEDLAWLIGPPLEASFAKLMGTANPKVIERCMRLYRGRYESEGLFESHVYPGIAEALHELSQNYSLYLATAKPEVYGRRALEHYGLNRHFAGIYGSDFDGSRTEKEELIEYIVKSERINVETALMVGDRKYDVLGAKANGVSSVGVVWGFGSMDELAMAGAEFICTHPKDLIAISDSELAKDRAKAA